MAARRVPSLTVSAISRSDTVPAKSFADMFVGMVGMLREIDKFVASLQPGHHGKKRETLEWEIASVTMASPLTLDLVAKPLASRDISEIVSAAFAYGIQELETSQDLPALLPKKSFAYADQFLSPLKNGIPVITVVHRRLDLTVTPTARAAERARVLAGRGPANLPPRGDYFEEGQIEGYLRNLIGHGKVRFHLWESLTNHRIVCHIPAHLQEIARSAWQGRVLVHGRIRYNAKGRPRSIQVTDIIVKPSEGLPMFEEQGVDITGGVESSEFIRNLRDAY